MKSGTSLEDLITRIYTSQDDDSYKLYAWVSGGGGIHITTMAFPTCRYIKITVRAVEMSGGGAYVNFSEPVVFDLPSGASSTGVSEVSHKCNTQNDYMTVVITADTKVTYSAHYYDKTTYSEDEILITEVT